MLLLELMDIIPNSKPLSSSYHEQGFLVKSNIIGVLGLAIGDVYFPHTFHNFHAPFQHFISPLFSSKIPQPTSCSSIGNSVATSCSKHVVDLCFPYLPNSILD